MRAPLKNTLGGKPLTMQCLPPKWLILSVYRLVLNGSLRRCDAGDGHAEW